MLQPFRPVFGSEGECLGLRFLNPKTLSPLADAGTEKVRRRGVKNPKGSLNPRNPKSPKPTKSGQCQGMAKMLCSPLAIFSRQRRRATEHTEDGAMALH